MAAVEQAPSGYEDIEYAREAVQLLRSADIWLGRCITDYSAEQLAIRKQADAVRARVERQAAAYERIVPDPANPF